MVALVILVAITVVMAYQYAKMRGMDGIQGDVYQLILKAETQVGCKPGTRTLTKVDAGFVTEEMMMKVIDEWFKGVKDLLDDRRVNGSQQ